MKWPILFVLSVLLLGCAQQVQQAPTISQAEQQYVVQHTQPGVAPAQTPSTPSQTAQSVTVKMQGFRFVPASVSVAVGAEVVWVNMDSVPHTVTIDALGIDEQMAPNAQFSNVFTQAGTYDIRCAIHPSMRGTVLVG